MVVNRANPYRQQPHQYRYILSTCITPITVPIIPNIGANDPMARTIAMILMCRFFSSIMSVLMRLQQTRYLDRSHQG